MSVISDALKTAQREKQRRESPGARVPPVLVPLRNRPQSGQFSIARALGLGVGGAAVFAAAWFGYSTFGNRGPTGSPGRVALSPSPPTPYPQAAATAVTDTASSDQARRVDSAASKVAVTRRPDSSRRAPAAPPRIGGDQRVAAVASQPRDTAASLQGGPPGNAAPAPGRARDDGSLRIAVEHPREDAARLFAAAVAAQRSGDRTYARATYQRVLAMNPNNVDALNNLGVLLLDLREFDGAERMLRRASTLAPGNAGIWNNLGNVLRDRGRTGDAIAAFQHALSLDPSNQSARVSLAQQYLVIGSLPQARQLLDEVLAVNPALPEAHYALGQVLELQGDKEGALRAYETFVRLAPERFATHVAGVRRRMDELNGAARP